jgi:predicted permease
VTLALDVAPDLRVLSFTLVVSLLTGVFFGLAPAVQASRVNLVDSLKEGMGLGQGGGRARLRRVLVVGQVCVASLLLVVSVLFLRSLANASAIDPGFDPRNVVVASVDLSVTGRDEARGRATFGALLERVRSIPAVTTAGLSHYLPLGLNVGRTNMEIEGYQPRAGEDLEIHSSQVTPGYFEALRIPILRGRVFLPTDTETSPGVAIVNEAFARRYWPGQDPIGKRISRGGGFLAAGQQLPYEVVGVTQTGKYSTLGEEPKPYVYYLHAREYESEMMLVVRTAGDPAAMLPALREQVRALDPALPLFEMTTLEDHLGTSLFPIRAAAAVLGTFGFLGLLLASVGVYGVLAFLVSQRRHEIGIRLALGAQRADILRMILRHGLGLVTAGLVLGLAAAAGVTHLLTFLLYGISPLDPVTFAGIALVLLAVALVASWAPALRATRVDPIVALRHE